jgi:ABC-type microcin C transport system permease subunit YejB
MTESQELNDEQLEELKRKFGIDERIAERYDLPKDRVERDFDPRLVKLIRQYLGKNREGDAR